MTINEVMKDLKRCGNDQTKKIYIRHGAREPLFGVKLGDTKKIAKKIRQNHQLAIDLYDTGNSDAMYMAGLIADPDAASKKELRKWANSAYWYMLSEYTVPSVAAASPYGWELGLEWIKSGKEMIEACGWSTLSRWISAKPEKELELDTILKFLKLISNKIHSSKNRVRYAMNGFVIAVGSFVPSLRTEAMEVSRKIGKVSVDMGDTACKVPLAEDYIKKVLERKNKKPRNAHSL